MATRLPNGSTLSFGPPDCLCAECPPPTGGQETSCSCFPVPPVIGTMRCTVVSGCPCLNGRTIGMRLTTVTRVPHGIGLCGDPRHPLPNYPPSFPTNENGFGSFGENQGFVPQTTCMYPNLPTELTTLGGFGQPRPMQDYIVNPFDLDGNGVPRRGTPFPMVGQLSVVMQCCNFDFFNGNNPNLPPSPDMIGAVSFGYSFQFALGVAPILGPPPGWQSFFKTAHAAGIRSDREFVSFRCSPFELVVDVPLNTSTFTEIQGTFPGLPNSWRESINLCPGGTVTLVFTE